MTVGEKCDALCVCELNGAVWLGVGFDNEDGPRAWFGMTPEEARAVARNIMEAAAVVEEHRP